MSVTMPQIEPNNPVARFIQASIYLGQKSRIFQAMGVLCLLSGVYVAFNGTSSSAVPSQPGATAAQVPGTQQAANPSMITGAAPASPAASMPMSPTSPSATSVVPGQMAATPAPVLVAPNGQMTPMSTVGAANPPMQQIGGVGGGVPPAPISPTLSTSPPTPVATSTPPVAITSTERKVDLSKMQIEEVEAPRTKESNIRFGEWNQPKLRK